MSLLPMNPLYSSSYEGGCLFTVTLSDPAERETLVAATAYNELIEAQ